MLLVVFTREAPLRGLGLPLLERASVLAMLCARATQWDNANFFELTPADASAPQLVHSGLIAAIVETSTVPAEWGAI